MLYAVINDNALETFTDDREQFLCERIEARWERARLESFKFCEWVVKSRYRFMSVGHFAEQLERLGRREELSRWMAVGVDHFSDTLGHWIDCQAPLALAAGMAPEAALDKSFDELKAAAGMTDDAYKAWNFGRAEIWELV